MNYRHAFHAGNFADIFKHILLARMLAHFCEKEAAFRYMDTHAGIGLYNLAWDEARRTKEAEGGITAYRRKPAPASVLPLLEPYEAALSAAAALGKDHYPGSPFVAATLLRRQDRLTLAELHPDDARALRRRMGQDRRITLQEMDGWTALKAWLPPPERRGLVLVDPPFEDPDEFARMTDAIAGAHRRWPTGTLAFWYPVKGWREAERFATSVKAMAIPKTLRLEISVDQGGDERRLTGTGMIIVNPPWKLKDEAALILPWLVKALAAGPRTGWKAEWLVGE